MQIQIIKGNDTRRDLAFKGWKRYISPLERVDDKDLSVYSSARPYARRTAWDQIPKVNRLQLRM